MGVLRKILRVNIVKEMKESKERRLKREEHVITK